MLLRENLARRKLRSLAWRIFNALENNNDARSNLNGERAFIEHLFVYFRSLQKGPLVAFDIGANVGDYSRILLEKSDIYKLALQLHLFEPSLACCTTLRANLVGNESTFINAAAASDSNGTASIFFDKEQSRIASLHRRNIQTINMSRSEEITTIRLDHYIETAGMSIPHIDLLKIDVEGHELHVLRGLGSYLNSDFIDFIQFEYGGTGLDSGCTLMALFALLTQANFRVGKVMKGGIELRSYQPWMENFQYANYVAISERVLLKMSIDGHDRLRSHASTSTAEIT